MRTVPIILASKIGEGENRPFSTEGLVNLYPEPAPGIGAGVWALKSFPGMVSRVTIGGGQVRGQSYSSDRGHFTIVGQRLYRVQSDLTAVDLGLIEGTRLCDIRETNNSIVIVADTRTYLYNHTFGTLSEIADPDFPGASSCTFLEQRIVFSKPASGQFFWTEVNEDGSIDPEAYATAEVDRDNLIAVRNVGQSLVGFGERTFEVWVGTGEAGANAFARSTGAAPRDIGCLSRDSIATAENTLVFMGKDSKSGGVMVSTLQGRISTHALEAELEKHGDYLSTARALTFMLNGHLLYELTIPQRFSAVYDFATREWFQTFRGLWPYGHRPNGDSGRCTLAVVGTKRYTGLDDGNLYEIDADTNDNAGIELIREVSTPPWIPNGTMKTVSRIELDVETGVGLTSGDDADPLIMLSVSKDNGRTWSAPRNAQIGAQGAYGQRVYWTRFGASRDWRFKFRVSGNVPVTLFQARATYEDHGH